MKSIEEIINGLECCIHDSAWACDGCGFRTPHDLTCRTQLMRDALGLIRMPDTLRDSPAPEPHDAVNHPSHYTQGGIECIDAIKAATTGLEGIEAVCTANVIKYTWRWKGKNGAEDLRKAEWYLNRLIAETEG